MFADTVLPTGVFIVKITIPPGVICLRMAPYESLFVLEQQGHSYF